MNTKLHAVADADGRPIRFFMTAGEVRDYTGAAALLDSLPKAEWLLAGRGLATHRNSLRQVPEGLPLRRRPRRNRSVLAMTGERDAVTGPASRPARYRCNIEGKLAPFPY